MTILHSKNSQQGDSDDPPPKKKSKKSKSLIRSQAQTHVVNHPTTSSGAGPSHRLPEQIGLYSFLSSSQSYYGPPETESFLSSPQHYFGQSEPELQDYFGQADQEILKFKLDKFDVGVYSDTEGDSYTFEEYTPSFPATGQDLAVPGTSQTATKSKINVRSKIYNPDSLEYYIYGPGSRSPNSKICKSPPKKTLPDENLIEVISSEEIVSQDRESSKTSDLIDENKFEGGSLLDDINNFDIDDKFGELERFQQEAIWENSKMYHMEKSLEAGIMINGYDKITSPEGPQYENRLLRTSPAASLSNLGNTCFLNSVLYTLRFAPNFLHNLHHLVCDMNMSSTNNNSQVKQKTSSLGRNMSLSWSANKDLTNGSGDPPSQMKTKKQIVTERLHEVYEAMHNAEMKEHIDPFHPDVFLTALREVNPIFEGNQQQDAHELLVCLLDIFRETCQASARQAESRAALEICNYSMNAGGDNENAVLKITTLSPNFNKSWVGVFTVRNSMKGRTQECLKSRKNEKNASSLNSVKKKNKRELDRLDSNEGTDTVDTCSHITKTEVNCDKSVLPYESSRSSEIDNFVAEDFEGVMVLKTTCLECENTTEKKEPFADICVPIKTDYNDEEDESMDPLNPCELYQRAVVTDEFLREKNKYYCEECLRYNEARRSVRYQTLPRLLTLQLKRFSSTYGAMSKVTQYMPTPMSLSCFCEECRSLAGVKGTRSSSRHRYELYGVIMHLGPNMAGGHYIAYVKTTDNLEHYRTCTRDKARKASSLSSDSGKSNNSKANNKLYNFFKNKGNSSNSLNEKINETKNLTSNFISPRKICRSLECCGVKNKMADSCIMGGSDLTKDEYIKSDSEDTVWIACDDDNVKLLTGSEVQDLLAKNSTSNATPYLLFYSRTE